MQNKALLDFQSFKETLRQYGEVRQQLVDCGIDPKKYDDKIRAMKIYESLNGLRSYTSETVVDNCL